MSLKWMQVLEDAIVGRLVGDLIEEGFRVELSDQDDSGFYLYAAPNGGEKPEGGWDYFVRLTLGNGADVIADYSTNMERIIKSVNKFAELWAD